MEKTAKIQPKALVNLKVRKWKLLSEALKTCLTLHTRMRWRPQIKKADGFCSSRGIRDALAAWEELIWNSCKQKNEENRDKPLRRSDWNNQNWNLLVSVDSSFINRDDETRTAELTVGTNWGHILTHFSWHYFGLQLQSLITPLSGRPDFLIGQTIFKNLILFIFLYNFVTRVN